MAEGGPTGSDSPDRRAKAELEEEIERSAAMRVQASGLRAELERVKGRSTGLRGQALALQQQVADLRLELDEERGASAGLHAQVADGEQEVRRLLHRNGQLRRSISRARVAQQSEAS